MRFEAAACCRVVALATLLLRTLGPIPRLFAFVRVLPFYGHGEVAGLVLSISGFIFTGCAGDVWTAVSAGRFILCFSSTCFTCSLLVVVLCCLPVVDMVTSVSREHRVELVVNLLSFRLGLRLSFNAPVSVSVEVFLYGLFRPGSCCSQWRVERCMLGVLASCAGSRYDPFLLAARCAHL